MDTSALRLHPASAALLEPTSQTLRHYLNADIVEAGEQIPADLRLITFDQGSEWAN